MNPHAKTATIRVERHGVIWEIPESIPTGWLLESVWPEGWKVSENRLCAYRWPAGSLSIAQTLELAADDFARYCDSIGASGYLTVANPYLTYLAILTRIVREGEAVALARWTLLAMEDTG